MNEERMLMKWQSHEFDYIYGFASGLDTAITI